MTDTLDAQARAIAEQISLVKSELRPLDCGVHYCRYCSAGTANKWEHTKHCPYVLSVEGVESARRILDELTAGLQAVRDAQAAERQISISLTDRAWKMREEVGALIRGTHAADIHTLAGRVQDILESGLSAAVEEAETKKSQLAETVSRQAFEATIHVKALRAAEAKLTEAEAQLQMERQEFSKTIWALRGALGYSVPGDFSERMADGTIPLNGIAQALHKQLAKAEAQRARLQEALRRFGHHDMACDLVSRWSEMLPNGSGVRALTTEERKALVCTCGLAALLTDTEGR